MTETKQPPPDLTETGRQQPRLEYLDPRTLRTATNVRTDLRLDKDFVDSVRQHGILEPIVGHRGADGTVTIAYGHRRAAAAVEAGLPSIPILVHDQDASAASGADRVLAQVVENDHRTGLSTAERVGAYRQLAAFGLSPTQIARRSSTRKTDIDQALKVAASDLAVAATGRYDLTLDQAAVLSDFDHDKEAVTALVAGAKTGQFAHVAQRLRDQRDYDQAVTVLTARLGEQGVTVLPASPDAGARRGAARRLDGLTQDGQPLDPESHRSCPGHAAYLERSWGEDLVAPVWVCTDAGGNGHTDRHRSAGSHAGPGAELSEAEKAERRQVRSNNTDWRSAETVRRDYLRQLLGRKTPPAGARRFLAEALVAGDHPLRRALERGHPLARDLLGADSGAGRWTGPATRGRR
jgi:ParB family chromosome partitioning protein